MTDISKSIDDLLDEVLDLAWTSGYWAAIEGKEVSDDTKIRQTTQAQIQFLALFRTGMEKIIGEDEPIDVTDLLVQGKESWKELNPKQDRIGKWRNQLRATQRQQLDRALGGK